MMQKDFHLFPFCRNLIRLCILSGSIKLIILPFNPKRLNLIPRFSRKTGAKLWQPSESSEIRFSASKRPSLFMYEAHA